MNFYFTDDINEVHALRAYHTDDEAMVITDRKSDVFKQLYPRKRKILILSVSAGSGHIRAAEALRAYSDAHDEGIVATHVLAWVARY